MERFDMEILYEKAGGPFRLTVLVQKRLKQLNSGAQPLVVSDSSNLKSIVYQEVLEGKIELVEDESIEITRREDSKFANVEEMFRQKRPGVSFPFD